MKIRICVLMFAALLAPALMLADTPNNLRSFGYVFAAPMVVSAGGPSGLYLGGGVHGFLYRGLSAGMESGYGFPGECARCGIGLLSVNGNYHFGRRGAKLLPFVTGGYSGAFREGWANGANFGGGVDYWFKPRVGLRLAVRDHVFFKTHFVGFQIGVTFR